jgi:hypothetical protein
MEIKTINILDTHFRYLKPCEVQDIHYTIGRFCKTESSVELLRVDFLNLISAACTRSGEFAFGNSEEYVLHQRRCVKFIELAFVLKCSSENFQINKQHELFRLGNFCFGLQLEEKRLMGYPALYFRMLSNIEINNIAVFFNNLFTFMGLEEWTETMEYILTCAYSSESYSDITDDGHRIVPILIYIEKLVEAIFLVYHLKSKDYIQKNYADEFGLQSNV